MIRLNRRITSHGSMASMYLDLARALAAIEVMTYHIRPTLFVSYADIRSKSIFDLLLYALTDKGFQAVMVFFVLSGFFISSSVLKSIRRGTWSWVTYLNSRLIRLWLVLIPALALTYVWNKLSLVLFHGYALVGNMSIGAFAQNVFFLQGIGSVGGPPFGANGPLWSLAYEFWYYILFPCIVLIFTSKRLKVRLLYAVVAIIICVFIGKAVLMYFAVWLMGTVVAIMPRIKSSSRIKRVAVVLTFGLFVLALGISQRNHTYSSDITIGLTFALFAYLLVSYYSAISSGNSLFSHWCYNVAGFSYTLYLVHFPFNNFVSSWLHGRKIQPTPGSIGILFTLFCVTVLYAWVISLITETHTMRVRNFTASLLRKCSRTLRREGVSVSETYVK